MSRSVTGLAALSPRALSLAEGSKRGREEKGLSPRPLLRPFALLRAEEAQDRKKLKVGQAECR